MGTRQSDSLITSSTSRLTRRSVLRRGGVGLAATTLGTTGLHTVTAQSATPPAATPGAVYPAPANGMSPDEALAQLIAGNKRYAESSIFTRDFSAARAAAVTTHAPMAGILACADARVVAEMVFDQGPGDLFTVRVAGNVLGEFALASLEYCVRYLHAPLLMVLGHTKCGAVTSALQVVQEQALLPGSLPFLIDAIEPAIHTAGDAHPDDLLYAATVENVRRTVRRLSTISPIINAAQEAGEVKVVGGIYDLANGKVTLF